MKLLSEILEYRDGLLYWKVSNNQTKVGAEAGKVDSSGYKRFVLNGKRVLTHRIVYSLFYGECPKYLDHIDGNKLNNQLSNLRPATAQENSWNRVSKRELPKNVYSKKNRYTVAIRLEDVLRYFGSYKTVEEAHEKATEVRKQHHGSFAT